MHAAGSWHVPHQTLKPYPTLNPSTKLHQAYTVRGLAYSPDSCLLAVAQSDAAVFVYRLGTAWGDPKAICNRFVAGAPATCLTWPSGRLCGPVFGSTDGQVTTRLQDSSTHVAGWPCLAHSTVYWARRDAA